MRMHKFVFNKIEKSIVILFGMLPLLPNSIKGIPVILIFLLAIYQLTQWKNQIINKNRVYFVLIMSANFMLFAFSYFYSNNTAVFYEKLETTLALIIIPFSLFVLRSFVNKHNIELFQKVFIVSSISLLMIYLIYLLTFDSRLYSDLNLHRYLVNRMPFWSIHPIYISLFLGLSLIFCIFRLRRKFELAWFAGALIIVFGLILFSSKMVIISLFFLLMIGLSWGRGSVRNKVLIVGAIILIFSTSVFVIPSFNNRFQEMWNSKTYSKIDENNSTSIRRAIYGCSIPLAINSGFFGYGLGDTQDLLNFCYEDKALFLKESNLNTHNQFLSIILSTGVIGFCFFILVFLVNIYYGAQVKDFLFLLILVFFIFNLITENILERRSGVVLFSFVMNFWGFFNLERWMESERM